MHQYAGHPQNVYQSGPESNLQHRLEQLNKQKTAQQMQYQQRYSQSQRQQMQPEHMPYQHQNQEIYESSGAKTYIGQQNILAQNVTMTSKDYYNHPPPQQYNRMMAQDTQIYMQANQQMAPMMAQQPPMGKQPIEQYQVMENTHFPQQNQIGQNMRTSTQQIHHSQSHRNQNMPLYEQNQHQRQYMPPQQPHPHHPMGQSRQSSRVERPIHNYHQSSPQGHQGSERSDRPQQSSKNVMPPQAHQRPPYHQPPHGQQQSSAPLQQKQNYNNISAISNQVTIPHKLSRQNQRPEQMIMQSQNPPRQSIPREEEPKPVLLADTTNHVIEEDFVDPDMGGSSNCINFTCSTPNTLSQKQNRFQEHSTASFKDKSMMHTSQTHIQSSFDFDPQIGAQVQQYENPLEEQTLQNQKNDRFNDLKNNQQSQLSFQNVVQDELENTYDNVEQNGDGEFSMQEEGENEYTTIQDCNSQYFETRQEMANDNSQMIYDQSFHMSQCSNESQVQDNQIDDLQDQGYDGDAPLDKSHDLNDQDFIQKPLDELLDKNMESKSRESQHNNQNYNNLRGQKNRKQALSQNSYDHEKYENEGLDQNQEKKHDEQYLTVDDGNVSASRVSHFQESFGRAPQNSNDHNNVSTVSLGKESGTFFQNKEGYHKSSAPENSASFGDLDNQDNDASRSKLHLTDEDQTIDPNLQHQEQPYQGGNEEQFSIGDNDDPEGGFDDPEGGFDAPQEDHHQFMPSEVTDFLIEHIIDHFFSEDGQIFFLCEVSHIHDLMYIPSSKILTSAPSDSEIPQSQEDSSNSNVNKVHLKFYCNSKGIDLNGLDKIKDLIEQHSSNEKSQDGLLQETQRSPQGNTQNLEVTQEIWSARMQSNQGQSDQKNQVQESEDQSPIKKGSSKRRRGTRRDESPDKLPSNHLETPEQSPKVEDDEQERIMTRSGRISKKPAIDNGYVSDISTLQKAKRAPKVKSSQKKGRPRRSPAEDDGEDHKSQQSSDKISESEHDEAYSQEDGNVTEFEQPGENNFYYDNNDDDQSNNDEDENASNSSEGEYISNERHQTTQRNQNQLGFGSEPVSSSSQKQNQENSKDDDEDTVSMPQRRSTTRQKSRRDQIDEVNLPKRKTGSKRKHPEFEDGYDGYKTQPYEPNSPMQQDELLDADPDYQYQDGEKPRKIAAWQIAHKADFQKNYEQGLRRKNRPEFIDTEDYKEQKRSQKIAQGLIQKRDNIQGHLGEHEAVRIISFKRTRDKKHGGLGGNEDLGAWNEFEDQEANMNFNPMNYPYHEVMCKVEWAPLKIQNETITIQNSQVPYKELREKAPHLLCEFFERHMKLK